MKGKEVLNYIIQSLIGKGGMGSVYLAEHKFIKGQMAAIKVINANMLNDYTRKKLLEEATNQSKLGHQNIAHFQNFHIDDDGNAYLIMEYADGLSLEDYINTVSGLIVEDRICPLFEPILDAIGYAHKHKILHCDIKPANIVVTKEGTPKVLDFGIAKIINEDGVTEDDNLIAGTPSYMSPEQVRGEQMDARSDIYSLGVLLHQMLTGNAPYDTTTLTEHEINEKVVNEPLPRMRTYYKYVSDKVQKVVDKATAKNPKDRYQSCADFKKELHEAIYPNPIPRWVWTCAAVFVTLVIGVGTYVWDYNRTKTYYYKDYVEQWGVPRGIGKLTKDEVLHREASYRFECSKRKVRRMSLVNSYGKITDHHDSEHMERPSDMLLFYNDNGNISYTKILDKSGKILYKKSYNDKLNTVIFQYDDANSTEFVLAATTMELFKNPFASAESKGKITRYLLTYDDNGFVERQEYASFFNTKVGDSDGIYARAYKRDEKGRVIEECYLGHDGSPKGNKKGLGIRRHKYNEKDDWTETSYYTVDGQESTDGNGVPIVKIDVDQYGNRIKESYVDSKGVPVLRTDCNAAGFAYMRNEQGFCTEMTYFDIEGNLCYSSDGVAGCVQEYDENGFLSKLLCIDDNKEVSIGNEGWAYRTMVNDSVGNILEVWFYDKDDKLVETAEGYAGVKMKYDTNGNQTEFVTYGTDKNPCIQSDNTSGYLAKYNEQGFIIKLTRVDSSLKPCKDNDGVIIWTREYDQRGNVTKISYFDENNKPALSNENIAGVNYVYDDYGNEIERSFFNTSGEPCLVSNTFHKAVYAYDKNSNLISERYYDLKNNLTLNSEELAGYDYVRDERGNFLESTPIGIDGKLKKGKLISKRKFDKFDNEIEFAVFDAKGPATNDYNYHRYECKYNTRNQLTEIVYYGKKGELVCYDKDKYAIQLQEYDAKGNRSRCTFLDTKRKPVVSKEGWHTSTYEYDAQGRVTRQLFYGLDGKPTNPKVMVPEGICKYDKWGNMIYIAALDGKGNFIINPNSGWSIMRREYNLRGDVLLEAYYSETDKPMVSKKDGYHKAIFEYDNKGNETSKAFWGTEEKPIKVEGFHKRTREYDKNGNNTMEAYWGTDNKAITIDGVHKMEVQYNEKGQVTDVRNYGTKGQPIEHSYGYHRFVVTYDTDGLTPKTQKYYRLNGSILLSLRWNGSEWIPVENNMSSNTSNTTSGSNWKTTLIEANKECPTDLGEEADHLTIVSVEVTSNTSFEVRMKIPYSKYEISEEQMEIYKVYVNILLQGMIDELNAPSSVKGKAILSDSKKREIYIVTK